MPAISHLTENLVLRNVAPIAELDFDQLQARGNPQQPQFFVIPAGSLHGRAFDDEELEPRWSALADEDEAMWERGLLPDESEWLEALTARNVPTAGSKPLDTASGKTRESPALSKAGQAAGSDAAGLPTHASAATAATTSSSKLADSGSKVVEPKQAASQVAGTKAAAAATEAEAGTASHKHAPQYQPFYVFYNPATGSLSRTSATSLYGTHAHHGSHARPGTHASSAAAAAGSKLPSSESKAYSSFSEKAGEKAGAETKATSAAASKSNAAGTAPPAEHSAVKAPSSAPLHARAELDALINELIARGHVGEKKHGDKKGESTAAKEKPKGGDKDKSKGTEKESESDHKKHGDHKKHADHKKHGDHKAAEDKDTKPKKGEEAEKPKGAEKETEPKEKKPAHAGAKAPAAAAAEAAETGKVPHEYEAHKATGDAHEGGRAPHAAAAAAAEAHQARALAELEEELQTLIARGHRGHHGKGKGKSHKKAKGKGKSHKKHHAQRTGHKRSEPGFGDDLVMRSVQDDMDMGALGIDVRSLGGDAEEGGAMAVLLPRDFLEYYDF